MGSTGTRGDAAVDPDCEVITGAAVGPAGGGDAAMTAALLDDLATDHDDDGRVDRDRLASHDDTNGTRLHSRDGRDGGSGGVDAAVARPVVYGDAAYGSGDNLALLERLGAEPMVKTQPAVAPGGRFTPKQLRQASGVE